MVRAAKRTPRSQRNGGFGAHSGPSQGDAGRRAFRPFETFSQTSRSTVVQATDRAHGKQLIEATIRIREGAAGNYPHLPWASSRLSLAGGAGNGELPRLLYRNARLRWFRVRGSAGDKGNAV